MQFDNDFALDGIKFDMTQIARCKFIRLQFLISKILPLSYYPCQKCIQYLILFCYPKQIIKNKIKNAIQNSTDSVMVKIYLPDQKVIWVTLRLKKKTIQPGRPLLGVTND